MTGGKENPQFEVVLAEDSKPGADGAASMPSRLARYSLARQRALVTQAYCAAHGHVKESRKLEGCANYLHFRHYYTVDKIRLAGASFCKTHLLCPMCAIRRGAKMLKAYLDRWEVVQTEQPQLRPYLVTLTVKNGDDLAERLRHLRGAMRAMFKARSNHKRGQRFVEFARSMGGFHSIEVTNRGKGWHPHVHMIWLCASEPSQEALSGEWHAWTGDSHVVDVRPLHDPVEGFMEVCKYALKFSDLEPADNWHAYEVMSGQRLIDSHGVLRGVQIPESLLDEQFDDLPFVDLFYRYVIGAGYSLTTRGSWGMGRSPMQADNG